MVFTCSWILLDQTSYSGRNWCSYAFLGVPPSLLYHLSSDSSLPRILHSLLVSVCLLCSTMSTTRITSLLQTKSCNMNGSYSQKHSQPIEYIISNCLRDGTQLQYMLLKLCHIFAFPYYLPYNSMAGGCQSIGEASHQQLSVPLLIGPPPEKWIEKITSHPSFISVPCRCPTDPCNYSFSRHIFI